jgi:predicted esterase
LVHLRPRCNSMSIQPLAILLLSCLILCTTGCAPDSQSKASGDAGSTTDANSSRDGGVPGDSGAVDLLGPPVDMRTEADATDDVNTDGGHGCESQPLATPISYEEATAVETNFIFARVDNPRALVLMFHGGGGDKEDNLTRVDPSLIARGALERGYAVASLDSFAHRDPDAPKTQWSEDALDQNKDIENTLEMIRKLKATDGLAVVPPETPVVALGISNGGTMASRIAQVSTAGVQAAIIYISNAQVFHEANAIHPPMVLVPGSHDPGRALGTNTDLAGRINDPTRVLLLPNDPEPVTRGLFTRIPGIDCTLSTAIGDALLAADWLDDERIVSREINIPALRALLPSDTASSAPSIFDVLTEAAAGHAPASDLNTEVFDFIDSHL